MLKLSETRLYPVFTAFALLTAGCSSSPKGFEFINKDSAGSDEASLSVKVKRYREPGEVSPGFKIRVSSVADSSINGSFRVEHDGTLKLPYRITVNASGKTLDVLAGEINQAYTKFFKGTPDIKCSVAERKYSLDVRGLVEQPGKQLVEADTSLDEIIGEAKGLQKQQGGGHIAKYIRINQLGKVSVIKLNDYYTGLEKFESNWQGGEVIFFQNERGDLPSGKGLDPKYIRILGEIRKPGEYLFNERLDFFDYFTKADGPTSQANMEKVTVIRTVDGKRVTYEFDIAETDEVPKIKGGDIVVLNAIATTEAERTVRLISTVMGILGSIAAIAVVVIVL